jgi:hypothetical protein
MTQQVFKVAKKGKSAHSTDPNDFVFHSSYNTFKIIEEGTKTYTLSASTSNQDVVVAHGLDFIPVAHAFAKRDSASQVFAPNGIDVELWGAKLGMSGDITFNYIESDDTNIIFNFDNSDSVTVAMSIRYFILERVS